MYKTSNDVIFYINYLTTRFQYSGTIQLVEGILRKIPPVVWLKGYSILLYKVYKRSICSINCGLLD